MIELNLPGPIPQLEQSHGPLTGPGPRSGTEDPVWRILDVVLIAVVAFVTLTLLVTFIPIMQGRPDFSARDLAKNTPLLVAIQTVAYLIVIAFMIFIVCVKYNAPFLPAISWNPPRFKRALLALLGGAGLALFSELASALLARWIPKSLPIDDFFRTRNAAYAMMLFGILVAPLTEELFFRGFLYPALARAAGALPSIILTSACFALLHAGQLALAWAPLLLVFIVGTVFTVVRAYARSVAMTVLIHMGYNGTLFTMIFLSTQGFRHLDKL